MSKDLTQIFYEDYKTMSSGDLYIKYQQYALDADKDTIQLIEEAWEKEIQWGRGSCAGIEQNLSPSFRCNSLLHSADLYPLVIILFHPDMVQTLGYVAFVIRKVFA